MKQPEDNKTIDMFEQDTPEVWVCVGTTTLEAVPTWFYVFLTYEDATEFTSNAKGVVWDIYPCLPESPAQALANFKQCMGEIDAVMTGDNK